MTQDVMSLHPTRTTLLLLLLSTYPIWNIAQECPEPCTCPDALNLHVDCSNKILLYPPPISKSAHTLNLSHNKLGPVLNASFVQMHDLYLLDVSSNGLAYVMECSLSGMIGLKTVRFRENRLTALPEGLFIDATRIQHLDLSHNLFSQLPQDAIKHLPELKTFDISHNQIVQLKLGTRFQVPRHIQILDFSHNHIEAIKTESFEIASQWEASIQRTINLAFCRILSIETGAITKIPNIYDLDLTGNSGITLEMLTALLKELENGARNLDRLSLGFLNLTTVVPLLTQVSELSLKFLNVSSNNISNIPKDVFSTIRSLRVLDLSWNHVATLTAGFADLSNLQVLNISHNRMESFQGNVINQLVNLVTLDLSHNKLSNSQRVNLSPLIKLHHLKMNNNFLPSVKLPSNTSSLRFLDYHTNRIREFSGLDDAAALETIDLSDNDMVSVSGFLFRGVTKLKLANFSKNNIEAIDHRAFLPHSPLVVDLSGNFLKEVHYKNWVATQELNLSHNQIIQIDSNAFHGMTSLQTLDLSQNRIFMLPENLFHYLINLQHLNLAHNFLNNVQWSHLFRNLDQLDILDLGYNNISSLSESIILRLPKLQTLHLQTNLIRIINPRAFRDTAHLKLIDLSNNPLDCSCDMIAFRDWLQKTKISVLGLYVSNSTAYHCHTPQDRAGLHVLNWKENDFECTRSLLYLIIVCSTGVVLIIASVVSTVAYRTYINWRHKIEQKKKHKAQEAERKERMKKVDIFRLSNKEIAQAIQEALDRKQRHFGVYGAMNKQNNYTSQSGQTHRMTLLEKKRPNSDSSKDRDRNTGIEKNVAKESGGTRTRQSDKYKNNELENIELDTRQDLARLEAEEMHLNTRETHGDTRRQSNDSYVSQLHDKNVVHSRYRPLYRYNLHRHKKNINNETRWRDQDRMTHYAYEIDPRYRCTPFEYARRKHPYITSPAYTYHSVYDSANWQYVPQEEIFQESGYWMDGYKTVPASRDRSISQYEMEAKAQERTPDHIPNPLPSDGSVADEPELGYPTRKHLDEPYSDGSGHRRSQSYNFLAEDHSQKNAPSRRDREQWQYERILQTHEHSSQRAASQPALVTDWL